MNRKVQLYVAVVVVCSILALFCVLVKEPSVSQAALKAASCFVLLGLLADALQYKLAPATSGTIAFIPFLTIICLTPTWVAPASVASVIVFGALVAKQPPLKATFNVAQYVIATCVALSCYTALGGRPLLSAEPVHWIAYCAMFVAFFAVNAGLVCTVLALSEHKSIWTKWLDHVRGSALYDLMSLPFAFLFAIVYLHYGPMGVAALALPLLGARQLYRTNWQLENVNHELLQLMVAAIEARDPYTSGHSKRVAHLAKTIGRAIGLSPRDIERVGVAALLHDVGKIHEVFAPLLRKPGKLTADERLIMESHPIKSAELVANVSQLRDLVTPIRNHHERWDGTGYPDGLSGEGIPLWSRVIMFADTIDAMTTDRPYRAALGEAEVRAEFIRLRGRQFDPNICDALLASPQYQLLFDDTRVTTPAGQVHWRRRLIDRRAVAGA
jgi:putative nucleotidyltransferase with HDIG domain